LDRVLEAIESILERSTQWVGRLSAPILGAVGVVVMVGVGAGGYYAYRTYDYVQHDNNFCMSCHLMQEPFDLFAKSAHQGLGCKACHQPTLIARSQMALTQIVENPGEINAHAEVPNERCAHCHIEGDPEKWRLVANSAGHKVHLESGDPSLEGLQCVECHSTSVHEFAPIDRTCARSRCHEDKNILLGGMSALTIHCAGCHNFLAPVNTVQQARAMMADSLDRAILPDQEECLSCHAMRALVEMPVPDPHKGVCAACHNPHEQKSPADAVQSCAGAGCHTGAADLSPMHQGLAPGVLEDCTWCHRAHDFKVVGNRCLDCHQGLDQHMPRIQWPPGADTARAPVRERVGAMLHGPATSTLGAAAVPWSLTGVGIGWWAHEAPGPALGAAGAPQPQQVPRFEHARHRSVDCRSCHRTDEGHGALSVVTLADCRACHHREPSTNDCTRCHAQSDAPTRTYTQVRPVELSVGLRDPAREMAFPHERHSTLACGKCHTGELSLSARRVDCTQCHEDHHRPENDCAACHRAPAEGVHPPTAAHMTCSGEGCHQRVPFEKPPVSRAGCLACHPDQKDHRRTKVCADCHAMPGSRGGTEEVRG
jgi:nitrate/TMAO reductase-like tetraheme cytochrome c subunit